MPRRHVARRVIVENRLTAAGTDIQPTIVGAELLQHLLEPCRKELGIVRKPAHDDVAARHLFPLAAIDLLLLHHILIVAALILTLRAGIRDGKRQQPE